MSLPLNIFELGHRVMHFLPKDHDVEPVDWPWPWHILFWMLCFRWSFPSFLPTHFLVSWLFIKKTYNVYQFIIVYPFLSISIHFLDRFKHLQTQGFLMFPAFWDRFHHLKISQVPRRAGMKFKVAKRGKKLDGWAAGRGWMVPKKILGSTYQVPLLEYVMLKHSEMIID